MHLLLLQERVALQRMESQNQGTVAQDDVLVPAHHPGQVKMHGAGGGRSFLILFGELSGGGFAHVSTYHDAEA